MERLTLHDLANDVALVIEKLATGPAIVLGHAYGNLVARMLTTDHPKLVKAVILAAAQARHVAADVAATPFIAGDLDRPDDDRLAALRKAFFAPNHDARIWLSGWYPETLKMQHEAVKAVDIAVYWACGSVPLLELNGEYDAFKPKSAWRELSEALPDRVTTVLVKDAAHALFPEQPVAVWNAMEPWLKLHSGSPTH
jgi:pimeloyl-ACP methyl ester carboxylesterase